MNPQEYIESLPHDRQRYMEQLRNVINENLPAGFAETVSYGMICFAVPHSLYPKGYHCNPQQPLPFISIASQKNFIALYHMGIYADEGLLSWFTSEYASRVKGKLDMGKSCIRFKTRDDLAEEVLARTIASVPVDAFIAEYEASRR